MRKIIFVCVGTVALNCGLSGGLRAEPVAAADGTHLASLKLDQAVLMCLENNRGLKLERLKPDTVSTGVDQELAAFDPVLSGRVEQGRDRVSTDAGKSGTDSTQATLGVQQYFPTGTTVAADLSGGDTQNRNATDTGRVRGGVTVTQSLLRGFGTQVNQARVQQARIDVTISEYEFRAYAEALVADLEQAYWQSVLSEQQLAIVTQALAVAQRQLDETKKRIELGALAPTELPSAEAEVASRQQNVIDAQSHQATAQLQLARLLSPAGTPLSDVTFRLSDMPEGPAVTFEAVGDHVKVALRMRAEMNQARLLKQRSELEIVRTRNGLLPQLDFFLALGKSGYSNSFSPAVNAVDHDSYDATAGVSLVYALGQRGEKAQYKRAFLTKQQTEESLANLAQLVEVDVRAAMIEINRTREQIAATAATLRFREEAVRVEAEKLRIGKSTSLLVAQVQRDLLVSQVAEIAARINYRQAIVAFYRAEGTILVRHKIDVPGSQPVED